MHIVTSPDKKKTKEKKKKKNLNFFFFFIYNPRPIFSLPLPFQIERAVQTGKSFAFENMFLWIAAYIWGFSCRFHKRKEKLPVLLAFKQMGLKRREYRTDLSVNRPTATEWGSLAWVPNGSHIVRPLQPATWMQEETWEVHYANTWQGTVKGRGKEWLWMPYNSQKPRCIVRTAPASAQATLPLMPWWSWLSAICGIETRRRAYAGQSLVWGCSYYIPRVLWDVQNPYLFSPQEVSSSLDF